MARTKKTKPTGSPATLASNPAASHASVAAAAYTQEANKREQYRQFFELIDQIGRTAGASALYGALMSVLCFTGYEFFTSKLGGMLGKLFSDIFSGYAKLLLPQMLVPYATWIAIGIPAAIFAYHVTYAALTGTLGLNDLRKTSRLQSTLITAAFVLPFAGFCLGVSLGMSVSAAYWLTGALGVFTGVYLSELGQGIVQSFFPPEPQPEDQPHSPPANNVDADEDLEPAPRPLLNDYGRKKKAAPKLADEAKKARPTRKSTHEHEEAAPAQRKNHRN
ncbi:MAG: hypothetical protein HYX61_11680 [Gammaproteobacteria bacterium]|jgi:hypothetical protein|nr:hypothetical protein [Gammaproteobacteria bacterium]